MKTDLPSVPLSTPRWFRPGAFASVCVALAAGLNSVPALARLDRNLANEAGMSLMAATTLLCFALSRWVLRAKTTSGVYLTAVLGGALFGALNAGLTLCFQALTHDTNTDLPRLIGALIFGTLVGAVLGLPLGLVFGSTFAPFLNSAVRAKVEPAHDSFESVLVSGAAFMTLAGVFAGWNHTMPFRAMGYGLLLLGTLLVFIAVARDFARLYWFSRLQKNALAGFRLRPRHDDEVSDQWMPLMSATHGRSPEWVVEAVFTTTDGPFRSMERAEPVAVAHDEAMGAKLHFRRRLLVGVLVLVGSLFGVLSAPMSPFEQSLGESLRSYRMQRIQRVL